MPVALLALPSALVCARRSHGLAVPAAQEDPALLPQVLSRPDQDRGLPRRFSRWIPPRSGGAQSVASLVRRAAELPELTALSHA